MAASKAKTSSLPTAKYSTCCISDRTKPRHPPDLKERTIIRGKQLQVQGTCPAQWQQGEGMGLSLMGFTGFQKMHMDCISWDFFLLRISEN